MNTTDTQAATDNQTETPAPTQPAADQVRPEDQPLRRPAAGRMLAGVAGGIADYLGVDATLVRVALAVLAVVGGAGVPIYLAGWLLIPEEGHQQSIASEFIQSHQSRSL